MASSNTFTKDPDATLDYTFNWSSWLSAVSDTINNVQWVVSEGLTTEQTEYSSIAATIWISGGSVGSTYSISCRITTTEGRTDDRTIYIQIRPT